MEDNKKINTYNVFVKGKSVRVDAFKVKVEMGSFLTFTDFRDCKVATFKEWDYYVWVPSGEPYTSCKKKDMDKIPTLVFLDELFNSLEESFKKNK